MNMNIRLDEDNEDRRRTSTALTPPAIHVEPTVENLLERIAIALESIDAQMAQQTFARQQSDEFIAASKLAEQITIVRTHDGTWLDRSHDNLVLAAKIIDILLGPPYETEAFQNWTQRR